MDSDGIWWIVLDSDRILADSDVRRPINIYDGFWWILMDSDGF